MLKIDLTFINTVVGIVVLYYFFLFGHVTYKRIKGRTFSNPDYTPFMFVVIPAHNEEEVISHTIEAMLRQEYPDFMVLVMNDGSKDDTSARARVYEDGEKVRVIDRGPEIAGRGKGKVLNHALGIINEMVDTGHPALGGRGPEDVVIGIMDADGQLEQGSLRYVAPFFGDADVGGVQICVRIANADDNMLTRMQDIEFIGFSGFVQEARDAFGSVGMGGNGQFTRLAALRSVGGDPWTDCLTEDLDLGLTLVRNGWRIRFCPKAFVAQQGVGDFKTLFRQRTRWIQGHYQCWNHLPGLVRDAAIPRKTRVDLAIYLVMVIFIVIVSVSMVLSVAASLGLMHVETSFLHFLPEGPIRNIVRLVLSFGPLLMFVLTYMTRSAKPVHGRWLPAISLAFAMYTYMWMVAQVWAWIRMIKGSNGWVKTPRTASKAAV